MRKVRALVLAMMVAFLAVTPSAFAATSSGPTLTFADYGDGYNGVLNGRSANQIILSTAAGDRVAVYSIEGSADYAVDPAVTYSVAARSGDGAAKAAWVAVNGASVGTPLTDPKLEVVARQLAIWNLAGGTDYSSVANVEATTRADELVAAAQVLAAPATSFTVTALRDGGDVVVSASAGGTALAGVQASFPVAGGSPVIGTTDGSGALRVAVPAATTTFTATLSLPAGSVLAPSAGARVVTAAAVPFTVSDTISAAAAPAASPTPTSGGVVALDQAAKPADTRLASTGAPFALWFPLALLGTGGGLWVIRRRIGAQR